MYRCLDSTVGVARPPAQGERETGADDQGVCADLGERVLREPHEVTHFGAQAHPVVEPEIDPGSDPGKPLIDAETGVGLEPARAAAHH